MITDLLCLSFIQSELQLISTPPALTNILVFIEGRRSSNKSSSSWTFSLGDLEDIWISSWKLFSLWISVFVYNLISEWQKQTLEDHFSESTNNTQKHIKLNIQINVNVKHPSDSRLFVHDDVFSTSFPRLHHYLAVSAQNLFLKMTIINQAPEHRRWKRKQRNENSLISH